MVEFSLTSETDGEFIKYIGNQKLVLTYIDGKLTICKGYYKHNNIEKLCSIVEYKNGVITSVEVFDKDITVFNITNNEYYFRENINNKNLSWSDKILKNIGIISIITLSIGVFINFNKK